jgi:hypothetical protein
MTSSPSSIWRCDVPSQIARIIASRSQRLPGVRGRRAVGKFHRKFDTRSGHAEWITQVANPKGGYSLTLAPLVVKDRVIGGVGGGEFGIRGSIAAYDLSAGQLNVTAYAVKTSTSGLNVVVVNKDTSQNLALTASPPRVANSATLMLMTQQSSDSSQASLSATRGITIQNATAGASGNFSPSVPYAISATNSQIAFNVLAASAVLIQISLPTNHQGCAHTPVMPRQAKTEALLCLSSVRNS